MIVVLGATTSDDAFETACDYAVVDLTPELATKTLAQMDAMMMFYSRDRSLHELHFWDAEITFYRRELNDGLDDSLPRDGSAYIVEAHPTAVTNGSVLWTECQHMVIALNGSEPGVYWRARAKHSSLRMETSALPMSEIAKASGSPPSGLVPVGR